MPDNTEVTVKQAVTPEDIAKCMAVRKTVFMDEQGYDIVLETNPEDPASSHFLLELRETGEAIGTVRVHNNTHKFGRFAILKPHRGKGYATLLAQAPADHVRSLGGKMIYCHAQVKAINFYRRAGWVEEGPRHMEEGTEHQKMVQYFQCDD